MKRLLSVTAGLLSLSITAQAQVPPGAADCYLSLIYFKAQAVTGREIGTLVPTDMYPTWRSYFANRYTTLPDPYQAANACWELNNIMTRWPQMPSVERETWQNMWETSLSQEINFIAPVFPRAASDIRFAFMKHLVDELRETPQTAAPSATQDNSQAAIAEIQRRMRNAEQLRQFNSTFYGQ